MWIFRGVIEVKHAESWGRLRGWASGGVWLGAACGVLIALGGCERGANQPTPRGSAGGEQTGKVGMAGTTAQSVPDHEGVWKAISTIGPGSDHGWLDRLGEHDALKFRSGTYTVVPAGGARGGLDTSVSVQVGSTRFEVNSDGLKALDEAVLRYREEKGDARTAVVLQNLDGLIAGVMDAGGRAQAYTLFRMCGAWRLQALKRLGEVEDDERVRGEIAAKMGAIKAAMKEERLAPRSP